MGPEGEQDLVERGRTGPTSRPFRESRPVLACREAVAVVVGELGERGGDDVR